MKYRKPKLGGRYIAFVRGAFRRTLAVPLKAKVVVTAAPRGGHGSFPGGTAAGRPAAQFR